MDFGFSPEQELQRQVLRETLGKVCPPEYARRCDEEKRPPREAFDALAQAGWLGLGMPEEFGGQGGDQVDIAILLEETGRAMAGLDLWIFRALVYGGQAVRSTLAHESSAPIPCPGWPKASCRPRSLSPSPTPARMPPTWAPPRCATARSTC